MRRKLFSATAAVLLLASIAIFSTAGNALAGSGPIDPETTDPGNACPSTSLQLADEYHPVGLDGVTVRHYTVAGMNETIDFVISTPHFPPLVVCVNTNPLTGLKEILATATVSFGTDADQGVLATAWKKAGLTPEKIEALLRALDDKEGCVPKVQDCVNQAGLQSGSVSAQTTPQNYDANAYAYGTAALHIHGDTTVDGGWTWYKPRDSDPNYYYLPVRAWGAGHGSYWHSLKTVRAGTSFYTSGTHAPVMDFAPHSDLDGTGNCDLARIGVSAYGVTLSRDVHICKNDLTINLYTPNDYFRSQWNGTSRGCHVYTESDAWGKKPNGTPDSLKLYLYEYEYGVPPYGTTC